MGAILRVGPDKLWLPGQIKPQAIPKIDWTHPLTQKLISYWFDTGMGFYLDLVTGEKSVIGAGIGTTVPSISASRYGTGFDLTTAGHAVVQGPANFFQQAWTAPYSFAQGWFQRAAPSGASGAGWFSVSDASGNEPLVFWSTSALTNIFAYFGNAAGNGINLGAIPANNTFNVAVGVATGSNAQNGYLNGTLAGTGTQASNYSGAGLRVVVNSLKVDNVANSSCGSTIFFGAIWNRALNAQEAQQLYLDPYCFLIPASNYPALSAAAAAQLMGQQLLMM